MKKARKYKNSPYKQEVFKIKIYHNVLSTYWNIWYVPKWVHPCYCPYDNDNRNYKMGQLILKKKKNAELNDRNI